MRRLAKTSGDLLSLKLDEKPSAKTGVKNSQKSRIINEWIETIENYELNLEEIN